MHTYNIYMHTYSCIKVYTHDDGVGGGAGLYNIYLFVSYFICVCVSYNMRVCFL